MKYRIRKFLADALMAGIIVYVGAFLIAMGG